MALSATHGLAPRRRALALLVGSLGLGCWVLGAACAKGSSSSGSDDDDNVGATSGGGHHAGGGGHSSTTTSSGGATTTSTSSSSGGGGSSPCTEDPCKLALPQCGCDPGQKCTYTFGHRACVPDGSVGPGLSCTGNQCTAGYLCVQFGNPPSTCHKFCEGDADCAPPQGLCALSLTGSGGASPITLCSESCDPITNAGCPVAGMKCELSQSQTPPQPWFTLCLASGSTGQGGVCASPDDCAPSLSCFNGAQGLRCMAWCEVASPACPGNLTCGSLNPQLFVGSVEYGACS